MNADPKGQSASTLAIRKHDGLECLGLNRTAAQPHSLGRKPEGRAINPGSPLWGDTVSRSGSGPWQRLIEPRFVFLCATSVPPAYAFVLSAHRRGLPE
jgi:hypothetical protein